MQKFSEYFLAAYAVGGIIYVTYSVIGVAYPIVGLCVIGFVAWIGWLVFWFDPVRHRKRDLKSQGFHIEYVSPGVLRGDENQFAVVYYEENREVGEQIWFYGTDTNDKKSVLLIPLPEDWNEKVPDWAKNRRTEIVERIQKARRHIVIE